MTYEEAFACKMDVLLQVFYLQHFRKMLIVIPYKDYRGLELMYCLRGIEKFIDDPVIVIVGDKPNWLQNVEHIPAGDRLEFQFKERNIFEKILLVKEDFLFFNDDHFLLATFDKNTYHYSGKLSTQIQSYHASNEVRKTLQNTYDLFGDIDNYFRHGPIFCKHKTINTLSCLDWDKHWGYCVKSIYCHLDGVKGTEYPDLKIREGRGYAEIKNMTAGRQYFSTGTYAVNGNMLAFLEETYPYKSKFEK